MYSESRQCFEAIHPDGLGNTMKSKESDGRHAVPQLTKATEMKRCFQPFYFRADVFHGKVPYPDWHSEREKQVW